MASNSVIEALLDEAFAMLQHDTGSQDVEYVYQRDALRKRFDRILNARPKKADWDSQAVSQFND
jgi:hypothetical protein